MAQLSLAELVQQRRHSNPQESFADLMEDRFASSDLPSPRQFDFPVSESLATIPESTAGDRLRSAYQSVPSREDYEPSLGRKIGAGVLGVLAGSGEVSRDVVNAPYDRAYRDFVTETLTPAQQEYGLDVSERGLRRDDLSSYLDYLKESPEHVGAKARAVAQARFDVAEPGVASAQRFRTGERVAGEEATADLQADRLGAAESGREATRGSIESEGEANRLARAEQGRLDREAAMSRIQERISAAKSQGGNVSEAAALAVKEEAERIIRLNNPEFADLFESDGSRKTVNEISSGIFKGEEDIQAAKDLSDDYDDMVQDEIQRFIEMVGTL